ncbi:MAG: hypothetical protein KAW87_04715 [Candidatus Cloacimonetes bacterium]|nr:hypothetical protein [Candidatus Cloacimonadota bacterium]
MKASKIVVIAVIILLISGSVFAQKFGPDPGKKKEILTQYRDLELLKILDLTEEESGKVLPIVKEIDKNRETFHFKSKQILEEIEFSLKHNEDETKISELNNKLIKLEKDFNKEKTKLHEKLRSYLSEEKYAKFLLFNRDFAKKLKERIKSIHEKPFLKH